MTLPGVDALSRRTVLGAGLGLTAGLSFPSRAEVFPAPGKPIRIVIPAPPGGPADVLGRALGAHVSQQWGNAPVIVESKPGGASVPAALAVARSPADGYTLLLGLNTTHTQVPHMFRKRPFDPFNEFTPITQIYRNGGVLVAHPSVEAADLKELVALSRRTALPLPAGSPGPGTNGHLYIEMLNQQYGARLNHIPYKGSADAMRDLLGGFIQVQFDSPATSLPHLRTGRLKVLAVTGPERIPELPEVKTAGEQGFPALDVAGWMGLFGPAGLPAAVLDKLNSALVRAIRSPEIKAQFEPLGLHMTGTTPQEFQTIVKNDYEAWGQIIQQTGVKLD